MAVVLKKMHIKNERPLACRITEVFEKFEKPYKLEGAGLTLAELYLEEENIEQDSLYKLVQAAVNEFKSAGV